jgi:hypothetical protein
VESQIPPLGSFDQRRDTVFKSVLEQGPAEDHTLNC